VNFYDPKKVGKEGGWGLKVNVNRPVMISGNMSDLTSVGEPNRSLKNPRRERPFRERNAFFSNIHLQKCKSVNQSQKFIK
jgi:hypothetical protein